MHREADMEYIESKDIFLIIRETLGFIDRRVIGHGSRIAYMVYRMLELKGGYQKYELADISILMTLHDVGLYKTGHAAEMVYYETKDTKAHSAYGYLFCKYLSPRQEGNTILLHHHTDYNQLPEDMSPKSRELCSFLSIADRVDIYRQWLGADFDYRMFDKYADVKLSGEGLKLFYRAQEEENILEKLQDGTYEQELNELTEYMIFNNREMRCYLEMLMYCQGFKSEATVVDTVTRMCICQVLGDKVMLSPKEKEMLHYGALLCDIGMLAIPREIIEAPRKLAPEEEKILQKHVQVVERTMKDRMHPEILSLITAHHERGDGSGYPGKLKDAQMNSLQRILQVADVMSALMNDRPYRHKMSKPEIISILEEERNGGRLSRQVVDTVLAFYDDICGAAMAEQKKVLATYNRMNANYEVIVRKLDDR